MARNEWCANQTAGNWKQDENNQYQYVTFSNYSTGTIQKGKSLSLINKLFTQFSLWLFSGGGKKRVVRQPNRRQHEKDVQALTEDISAKEAELVRDIRFTCFFYKPFQIEQLLKYNAMLEIYIFFLMALLHAEKCRLA